MDVVLGPGWPGILLHEAVGHGLEGDFNRKKASAFAGLMGQRVAAPGVTVVDDGTIEGRRGSINIAAEGTPPARNVLIDITGGPKPTALAGMLSALNDFAAVQYVQASPPYAVEVYQLRCERPPRLG